MTEIKEKLGQEIFQYHGLEEKLITRTKSKRWTSVYVMSLGLAT